MMVSFKKILLRGQVIFANILLVRILFYIILLLCSYTYTPHFLFIQSVLDCVLIIYLTWLSFHQSGNKNIAIDYYELVLPLIAIIYFFLKILVINDDSWIFILNLYVIQLCSWIIFFRLSSITIIRKIMSVFYSIWIVIFHVVIFITMIASFFISVSNQIHSTIASPNGKYSVIVSSSNAGATAASTKVEIVRNGHAINIGLGMLKPAKDTLYLGSFGEEDELEIHWENDSIINIKGKKYQVGR